MNFHGIAAQNRQTVGLVGLYELSPIDCRAIRFMLLKIDRVLPFAKNKLQVKLISLVNYGIRDLPV